MHSTKAFPLIFLCFLANSLLPVISYISKDFEIHDLQPNTADFIQDAAYWQLTGLNGTQISTTCNNTYLLAGYGVLGEVGSIQRIYNIPQIHKSVFITFELWMMNNWTNTNNMRVVVGNGVSKFFNRPIFQSTFTGNHDWEMGNIQCNETSRVQIVPVSIQTPHVEDKLYFTIYSNTTINNQYFGLRNVKITISNHTLTSSSCITINSTSDFTDVCPCTLGYEKSSTGTYNQCDLSCSQCIGAGPSQCSICNDNYAYNGTTCLQCDPSCITCSGTGPDKCLSCPSDQYLYPSGKCLPYCASPFTSQIRNGINYCAFPCSQDSFLYQNNSCLKECASPFKARIEESAKYCECDSLGKYSVCLSDSDATFVEAINILRTTTQAGASVALAVSSLVSFGDPGVFLISTISQMLQSIRYFNISYTPRLEAVLDNFNTSMMSINTGISVPDTLQDQSAYHALPLVFSRYNLQASFIVNFWDEFVCIMILCGILIFIHTLEQIARRTKKENPICPLCRWIRLVVQNFVVIYLYREFGEIVFASLINFQAVNSAAIWSSTGGILSNIINSTMLLAGIVMLGFNIKLISQYQRNNIKKKDVKTANSEIIKFFQKKYENVQVLFRDFHDTNFIPQSILLFYILREIVFHLILTQLYQYPVIQVMWILLLNMLIIMYLVAKSPLKKDFDNLRQICFEVLLQIVYTMLICLTIFDKFGLQIIIAREILCFFVLAVIIFFNFAVLGPFVVKAVRFLKKIYSAWRSKRTNRIAIKVWPATGQPSQIKKNRVKMRELENFNSLDSDSEIELRQNPNKQRDKHFTSPMSIFIGETQNLDEAQSVDVSSMFAVKKSLASLHQIQRKCSIFKEGARENL